MRVLINRTTLGGTAGSRCSPRRRAGGFAASCSLALLGRRVTRPWGLRERRAGAHVVGACSRRQGAYRIANEPSFGGSRGVDGTHWRYLQSIPSPPVGGSVIQAAVSLLGRHATAAGPACRPGIRHSPSISPGYGTSVSNSARVASQFARSDVSTLRCPDGPAVYPAGRPGPSLAEGPRPRGSAPFGARCGRDIA